MAYVPINTQAYVSAYAGALAGMAVSGWIVDPTSGHYASVTTIAGTFAEAFDTVWNSATALNWLQIQSIQSVCQEQFTGHAPGSLDNPSFVQVSNWAIPASACAALVLEGDAYVTSQSIVPGTPGGGAVNPLSTTLYVDSDTTSTAQDGSIANPFATIQQALDVITESDEGSSWVVLVVPSLSVEELTVPPARFITIQAISVNPVLTTLNAVVWALGIVEASAELTLSGFTINTITLTGASDENNIRTLSLISCNVGQSDVETLGINGAGINVDVVIDSWIQFPTWIQGLLVGGKLTVCRSKLFGPVTAVGDVVLDDVQITTGGRTDGSKVTVTAEHGRMTTHKVTYPFSGIIDFNGGGNTRLLEDDLSAQNRFAGGVTTTVAFLNNLSGANLFQELIIPAILDGDSVDVDGNGVFGGSGFEHLRSCCPAFALPPTGASLAILGAWVLNAAAGTFRVRLGAIGANYPGGQESFNFYFRP